MAANSSPHQPAPCYPDEILQLPMFHPHLTKEEANELILQQHLGAGAYLIRPSSSYDTSTLSISLSGPGDQVHRLALFITQHSRRSFTYHIKPSNKFSSCDDLLNHYRQNEIYVKQTVTNLYLRYPVFRICPTVPMNLPKQQKGVQFVKNEDNVFKEESENQSQKSGLPGFRKVGRSSFLVPREMLSIEMKAIDINDETGVSKPPDPSAMQDNPKAREMTRQRSKSTGLLPLPIKEQGSARRKTRLFSRANDSKRSKSQQSDKTQNLIEENNYMSDVSKSPNSQATTITRQRSRSISPLPLTIKEQGSAVDSKRSKSQQRRRTQNVQDEESMLKAKKMNHCRPPAPLPILEDSGYDSKIFYSEVATNKNYFSEIYQRLKEVQAEEEEKLCDCGIRVVDSLLPDNWVVHLSTDKESKGQIFFQKGNVTSWDLPDDVLPLLTDSHIELILYLCSQNNSRIPPALKHVLEKKISKDVKKQIRKSKYEHSVYVLPSSAYSTLSSITSDDCREYLQLNCSKTDERCYENWPLYQHSSRSNSCNSDEAENYQNPSNLFKPVKPNDVSSTNTAHEPVNNMSPSPTASGGQLPAVATSPNSPLGYLSPFDLLPAMGTSQFPFTGHLSTTDPLPFLSTSPNSPSRYLPTTDQQPVLCSSGSSLPTGYPMQVVYVPVDHTVFQSLQQQQQYLHTIHQQQLVHEQRQPPLPFNQQQQPEEQHCQENQIYQQYQQQVLLSSLKKLQTHQQPEQSVQQSFQYQPKSDPQMIIGPPKESQTHFPSAHVFGKDEYIPHDVVHLLMQSPQKPVQQQLQTNSLEQQPLLEDNQTAYNQPERQQRTPEQNSPKLSNIQLVNLPSDECISTNTSDQFLFE